MAGYEYMPVMANTGFIKTNYPFKISVGFLSTLHTPDCIHNSTYAHTSLKCP